MTKQELKHYGGQALIEGVLMRGKKYVVAAFRKPDGQIHLEQEELTGIYKSKFGQLPFIRGLAVLWDSLFLGMKYLTLSANLQTDEDEKIEGPALVITLLFSIVFAVFFFFVLPSLFVEILKRLVDFSPFYINLIEGLFRLLLLSGYIWIVGYSKDIARVFAYHGAEHKTINAYESGVEINRENVMNYPLEHPRCGTSFLLTLVIISVIVFTLVGELSFSMRILSRIISVPLIAMIAYEIIRWLGAHQDNPFVKVLTYPNLLLQKLTTREPEPKMVEIAIASFERLLELE